MAKNKKKSWFTHFAKLTASQAGQPRTFAIATLTVVVWAAVGPIFHFSDTWQLVINTSTTIVTFLMVFLIQNTQNRDSEALQIKLDEIIRAIESADNLLLNLEELEEKELDKIRRRYLALARDARKNGSKDKDDKTA